eukprot:jgi/Bigna1/83878/fgenesh1_pg.117_\
MSKNSRLLHTGYVPPVDVTTGNKVGIPPSRNPNSTSRIPRFMSKFAMWRMACRRHIRSRMQFVSHIAASSLKTVGGTAFRTLQVSRHTLEMQFFIVFVLIVCHTFEVWFFTIVLIVLIAALWPEHQSQIQLSQIPPGFSTVVVCAWCDCVLTRATTFHLSFRRAQLANLAMQVSHCGHSVHTAQSVAATEKKPVDRKPFSIVLPPGHAGMHAWLS